MGKPFCTHWLGFKRLHSILWQAPESMKFNWGQLLAYPLAYWAQRNDQPPASNPTAISSCVTGLNTQAHIVTSYLRNHLELKRLFTEEALPNLTDSLQLFTHLPNYARTSN